MKVFQFLVIFLFLNNSNILSQTVTGTGIQNYVPRFTGTTPTSIIGNGTIYDNGTNVGIGTSTPLTALDVSGSFHTAFNTQALPLSYGTGGLSVNWNKSGGGAEVNFWNVYNAAATSFQFSQKTGTSTGADLMTIMANANTGIGVLPHYKLDIQTNTDNDGINLRYKNTGFLRIAANSYQVQAYNQITQAGDAGIFFGGTTPSANPFGFVIAPWSNYLNGLRMDKDGNVGIGTSDTNGNMLAVKGNAVFMKAIVKAPNNNWPDYVIDTSYILPALPDIEAYVNINKHLPGIPTATQVGKEGIDIGENQALLLKKVEELTLYLIEINKNVLLLNKEVKTLSNENELLKKEISRYSHK